MNSKLYNIIMSTLVNVLLALSQLYLFVYGNVTDEWTIVENMAYTHYLYRVCMISQFVSSYSHSCATSSFAVQTSPLSECNPVIHVLVIPCLPGVYTIYTR